MATTQASLFDLNVSDNSETQQSAAPGARQQRLEPASVESTTNKIKEGISPEAGFAEQEVRSDEESVLIFESELPAEVLLPENDGFKHFSPAEDITCEDSPGKLVGSSNTIDDLQREVQVRKSTRGRMKLSDMHTGADLIDIPEDDVLFKKSYYSIGTVSEMFKVNISLIRFWENEFDILKPRKNGKGDRHFRPEDVKNLKLIYHLLREKKYTIEGAKDFLKKNKKVEETFGVIESLKKMKSFLNEIKASL